MTPITQMKAGTKVNIKTYHAFGSDILAQYRNYAVDYDRRLDNAIDEEVTHVFVPGAFTQSVVADIDRRKLKATTFVLKDPTKIFIDKATWGRLRKSGLTVKVLENITVAAITVNPTSPAGYSFDHGELASAMAKAVPDIPVIDVMMA